MTICKKIMKLQKNNLLFVITILGLVFSCNNQKDLKPVKNYFSQEVSIKVDLATIYGTLEMPDSVGEFPVVLIIAGSGPTDRDGNSTLGVSAAPYKMLADSLAAHNIASLRYDKRLIGKSKVPGLLESSLRFDTYINDAIEWIKYLKEDKRFTKIIVIGHSEGSLIGAVAVSKENVDGFISLAGVGRPADEILVEQLSHSNYDMKEVQRIIDEIKAGQIAIVPDDFKNIFRVTVQPYMTSWFQYNPQKVFSELVLPVLIVQGNTDVQVPVKDAEILHEACKQSELVIIKGMNHILKNAPADTTKNIATYKNPNLPLNKELSQDVVEFITKLKK